MIRPRGYHPFRGEHADMERERTGTDAWLMRPISLVRDWRGGGGGLAARRDICRVVAAAVTPRRARRSGTTPSSAWPDVQAADGRGGAAPDGARRAGVGTPVSRWLPAFRGAWSAGWMSTAGCAAFNAQTPLTIHHLLTHTGGIISGPLGSPDAPHPRRWQPEPWWIISPPARSISSGALDVFRHRRIRHPGARGGGHLWRRVRRVPAVRAV